MKKKQINLISLIHFRQWSRKRFAVLLSLSRTIKICTLNTIYTIIFHGFTPALAQTDSLQPAAPYFDIDPVEVIGQMNSTILPSTGRMISLIPKEEILTAPVESLQDLLVYLPVADVSQRGPNGVQADISIRGGSFDHTMILLNGIIVSDPQTGHFNLDIPLDPDAIQRIEVLNGPAARKYGPGAFTGAINIVTKPGPENYGRAIMTMGDFDYRRLAFIGSLVKGPVANLINLGHSASAGYTDNTDFSIQHGYYCGQYNKDVHSVNIQAGYQHKAFGANGFYSPRYPDQYEENSTSLISLHIKTGTKVVWQSSAYWRRKEDHYVLQRNNPGFYQNYHLNQVFGTQINSRFFIGKTTAMAGFNLRSENILSTVIGLNNPRPVKVNGEDSLFYSKQYNLSLFSFFQEHSFGLGKCSVTAGYMINWYTDFPSKPALFPGLDIEYSFSKAIRAFLSLNRALHYPTLTDMFYTDPSHQGNTLLEPDRMVSAECGMHAGFSFIEASVALYKSTGKNIIDWLWLNEFNKYSPVNIKSMTATGIEMTADFFLQKAFSGHSPIYKISLGYHYLTVSKSLPDTLAKYYNLRHKLAFSIRNRIFRNISSSWHVSYQDRLGSFIRYDAAENSYSFIPYKPFWLIDGRLSWDIKAFDIFIESSNLLNCRYADAGSVIQPGRWIKAGIRIDMVFNGNKRKFENIKQP